MTVTQTEQSTELALSLYERMVRIRAFEEKVQQLLPFLDEAVAEGLITIEGVRVLRYRADEAKGGSGTVP